jgi:CBS domain-containing protein
MFDLSVAEVMDPTRVLTLPPDTSVSEAAEMMARNKIGAVLVVEDGRLTGIFTERDALFRVIACGLDVRTTRLSDVMTAEPLTVGPGSSYGYALLMMQENGFRHAPVVDDGKLIGIVSSRNAMDPDLEEFVPEVRRRAHIRAGR